MKRIHYFSGVILSIFIGFHLFNHIFSLFGVNAHITMMHSLRTIYRNIIAETILFCAVAIQLFSGIKLFIKKRKIASTFFEKLQIWTGIYLAVFFLIHISAVIFGRSVLNLDTNFYFGVAGLNTFPLNIFFIPYYALVIMSVFGHISAIHISKMKHNLFGLSPKKQSYCILGIGLIITFFIFYGATNGFKGVEIPEAYNALIGK